MTKNYEKLKKKIYTKFSLSLSLYLCVCVCVCVKVQIKDIYLTYNERM